MSKTVSFALKVPEDTIIKLKNFCKEHGMKIGFFIEKAVLEKMEREELIEDSQDIIRLRYEEPAAVSLEDYFEKRGI